MQELMMLGLALMLCGGVQDDLSKIADRLRAFRESWTSVEVRNRQDLNDHMRAYEVSIFENYVETAFGQRLLEWAYVAHNVGLPSRSTYYCDGKQCADVMDTLGRPGSTTVKTAFLTEGRAMKRECGIPLCFLYLMHEPLDSRLQKAQSLGNTTRLGRACERVLFTEVQWTYTPVEMVYELDREFGFPLLIQWYDDAAARAENRPVATWEALSFEEVEGGRRFPMKSVEKTFALQDGKRIEMFTREITVIEVKFDQDYPAAMFWPDTRPRDTIWSEIAKVRWHTPVAGVERSVTGEAIPVRAETPRDWTEWLPWAGLALGVAALCCALFLRWRHPRVG